MIGHMLAKCFTTTRQVDQVSQGFCEGAARLMGYLLQLLAHVVGDVRFCLFRALEGNGHGSGGCGCYGFSSYVRSVCGGLGRVWHVDVVESQRVAQGAGVGDEAGRYVGGHALAALVMAHVALRAAYALGQFRLGDSQPGSDCFDVAHGQNNSLSFNLLRIDLLFCLP